MGGKSADAPSREAITRRAKITIALCAGGVVVSAMVIALLEWSAAIVAAAARGEIVQPQEVTNLQMASGAIGIAASGVGLAKAVAFLRWLHGAHLRAQQLGAMHRLGHSARAAVVVWFIPIWNLYLPMAVVRGLAAASDPSDLPPATVERDQVAVGYRDAARVVEVTADQCPAVPVTAWWIAWLVSVANGVAAIAIERGVTGLGPPDTLRILQIGQLAPIAAGILSIVVVRNIDRRQLERARRWEAHEPDEDDEVERVAGGPDAEPAVATPRKKRRRARRPRSDG